MRRAQALADDGRDDAARGLDWSPKSLFEPETSLRFGARYLAAQIERFDDNVLAALAAYNDGPVNAQRWLDGQRIEGPDGHIIAIQFDETALYLQLVLKATTGTASTTREHHAPCYGSRG